MKASLFLRDPVEVRLHSCLYTSLRVRYLEKEVEVGNSLGHEVMSSLSAAAQLIPFFWRRRRRHNLVGTVRTLRCGSGGFLF